VKALLASDGYFRVFGISPAMGRTYAPAEDLPGGPNVAVITCAAEAHLEAFETVENVAREKGEILSFQNAADTAVLNADDPHLALWRGMAKGKVLAFGCGPQADVRARQLRVGRTGCAAFLACHGGDAVACTLSVPGIHQARNALAALAAALAVGMPLEKAVLALNGFEGMAGRFSVSTVREFTLIDDAYNASPSSFAAALETMLALPAERRYVIAGDMLELGAQAETFHRELGRRLAACGLAGLVTVGGLAQATGEAAVSHGLPRALWTACPTPQTAAQTLRPRLLAGDAVLVKGSHGVHLEECCALLQG
ncbi:MAG: Mur ligase family protein, partial [Planctomycetota bacterium]